MGQCCLEQQPYKVEASTQNDSLSVEQDYQIQRILQPLKQFETLPLPSYYSQVNEGEEEFSLEKNVPIDKIYNSFIQPKFEEPNIPKCDIFQDYPRFDLPIKIDKFIYIGQWKNFEPFGLGAFYYNDGSIYMGYSLNFNPHIYGKYKYPDGSEYEGEYLLGKHHGQGKLINKELCFEGIWSQNIPVKGIEQWVDGTNFQGEYENGYKHGQGIMKWKNGNQYRGMFVNDQFNGYGVYEFADGVIYEGQWKNSFMHGKGKLIYPNQCYLEGEFDNDIQISGIFVTVKGSEKTISSLSLDTKSIVKIDRPSIRCIDKH